MKYFEKAIENYAKEKKMKMKEDILRFNRLIEQMTADGKCPGPIECRFCPIVLATKSKSACKANCGRLRPQEVREIIAMEVSE